MFMIVTYHILLLFTGISNDCIEKVLLELAEFHATTFHFLQTVPGGAEKLIETHSFLKSKTLFESVPSEEEMHNKFLVQAFSTMSAIVAKAGHEELSQAVKKQESLVLEFWKKAAKPSEGCKFKTLIHGDIWYNNVMVK